MDIVMVTYNRLAFTKKVIEHLFERTKIPFGLIVVDNASRDGTQDYLNKLKDQGKLKRLICSNENLGLQRAKNVAFEHVTSPLFVDTDNDCLCPDLEPSWLQKLETYMDKYKDFGAIALRPQVLVGVGPIFKDAKEIVENNVVGGSLRIMRRFLVQRVGGWSDDFENRQEEWNICGKIKKEGYKVGYTRDIFTYHMFGEPGTWGYEKGVEHYHNPASKIYAKDVEYDPITCEPRQRSNE
jgi:GT2 family glycosyltransferase